MNIDDPRLLGRTHLCMFCEAALGASQFKLEDGSIATLFPSSVCDACYDATYPTPATSARARRAGLPLAQP